jgi:hypothetical protein
MVQLSCIDRGQNGRGLKSTVCRTGDHTLSLEYRWPTGEDTVRQFYNTQSKVNVPYAHVQYKLRLA